MSVRQTAGGYFVFQGGAVAVWWALLILFPAARALFRMDGSDATLLAFCLPDLAVLAAGSLAAGALCFQGRREAMAAVWLASGAVSYAALYCLGFSLMTNAGWLGATMMLPAALLSVSAAVAVSPWGSRSFRQAKPASTAWNLTKTGVQIVAFWSVLLFVVPHGITLVEARLGVARFAFPAQHALAGTLFLGLSVLGLWSGYTMVVRGSGTPLPVDSTRRLVVGGPYAFVRNPMAIAGLGQGLMAGLWLGSPLVLAYVGVGAWIWQFLVRPLEEKDMARRFGPAYAAYQRHVRCWRPIKKAYRGEA